MAKKPRLDDLFTKTEKADAPADMVKTRGVGLRSSEWAEIEAQAQRLNMNSHALAVVLIRYGLAQLQAGKIKTKSQITLDL
jgi:hypothetical protein